MLSHTSHYAVPLIPSHRADAPPPPSSSSSSALAPVDEANDFGFVESSAVGAAAAAEPAVVKKPRRISMMSYDEQVTCFVTRVTCDV